VISGEGGALIINDRRLAERAEILWEKGTDRSKFLRGMVDKYTWVDVGSSFLPGELIAAFLWAQMEEADQITAERMALWRRYDEECATLTQFGVRGPIVPDGRAHNAHLFYLILPAPLPRADLLADVNRRGVNAVFHYVPLHSSPAGRRYGRTAGEMTETDEYSRRLIRLPLWVGMGADAVDRVVGELTASVQSFAWRVSSASIPTSSS
jgi:dTDP-4-amino-4,6-dideoxygalactose transaminase